MTAGARARIASRRAVPEPTPLRGAQSRCVRAEGAPQLCFAKESSNAVLHETGDLLKVSGFVLMRMGAKSRDILTRFFWPA